MCWPYIVKVIHQPLPNIFINAFSHKLSGIFKEPCATQSVCFCHHLCWAPAHLPLHYWATSSDHLFSMRFRFSVNLQRWERKVLRLFGHSCSKPLGTSQLSQYNRYKAVSRRDEKGRLKRWVVGWVGEFGQDRERHLDTWSLVEMLRCRRYGVRQTLLQQQGNSSVSLQHSITYHGTHHGEPHNCLTKTVPTFYLSFQCKVA